MTIDLTDHLLVSTPCDGLSESDVRQRHQQGLGNHVKSTSSRSYVEIIRSNVFNAINIILFSIGALMIAIGRASDAITSVGLILMNIVIGIVQEIRAKRQLDHIALLTRPRVRVIRDQQEKGIDPADLVQGDMISLSAGDQIVVDGLLMGDGTIEVDESLLTGESDLVKKTAGDEVLSGSFCVSGAGYYQATKVGEDSFANRLTTSARQFQMSSTPLQREINLILRLLMVLVVFLGSLMLVATILSRTPLMRQIQMAAVIAGLVPNGLFFMVILAYAMGALRIVQKGALVQQSNAVESLSHVTVLCTDKTGTLTANRIAYDDVYPIEKAKAEVEALLATLAAGVTTHNKTSAAINQTLQGERRRLYDEVPFSSALKWSAVAFDDDDFKGIYVLGALEMLTPYLDGIPPQITEQLSAYSEKGLRVLAFAYHPYTVTLHNGDEPVLPPLSLLGLVTFTDELRPHLKHTLEQFIQNGISVKVISGDNPQTVAALARQAGLPGDLSYVSGPELTSMSEAEFRQAAVENTIFGRITPDQKEALVDSLRAQGHYVAMIGDGVNDVLSLKKADMGIAMESGSSATRSVADMVLLGDSFEALPSAFTEGQRIINGMKDILRLFMTRVLYSALLIIGISIIDLGFPIEPKHNLLIVFLSVAVPTLTLALWSRPGALPRGSMLREIAHFVIPAAVSIFVFGIFIYVLAFAFATLDPIDMSPENVAAYTTYVGINYDIAGPDQFVIEVATLFAQSALTTFLIGAGLLLVIFVEPPVPWFTGGDEYSGDWRPTLIALIMLLAFGLIIVIEPLRSFFELLDLGLDGYGLIALITAIWLLTLRLAWRAHWMERLLDIPVSASRQVA